MLKWLKYMCCYCFLNVNNKTKTKTNKNIVNSNVNGKSKIDILEKATPFVPPITSGIVTSVYDGDTFTLVSRLPYDESPLYEFKVRIAGIDCPEIRGKSPQEKDAAQAAKKEVIDLILYKEVKLRKTKLEKYGRLLADVYVIDNHTNDSRLINIGQHLLDKGLAKVYNGGTKEPFSIE
jgi:micrococcal nuclease